MDKLPTVWNTLCTYGIPTKQQYHNKVSYEQLLKMIRISKPFIPEKPDAEMEAIDYINMFVNKLLLDILRLFISKPLGEILNIYITKIATFSKKPGNISNTPNSPGSQFDKNLGIIFDAFKKNNIKVWGENK